MSDNTLRAYRIIRFYHPRLNRKPRTVKTGLTELEAQRHCSDPKTKKEGKYFDGYDLMRGVRHAGD